MDGLEVDAGEPGAGYGNEVGQGLAEGQPREGALGVQGRSGTVRRARLSVDRWGVGERIGRLAGSSNLGMGPSSDGRVPAPARAFPFSDQGLAG